MAIEVKYITTTAAKLSNVPVVDGQIIAIKDTDQYYYDMGGIRRTTSGQVHVTELPDSGLQDILYVLNNDSDKGLYVYDGSSFVLLASPNTDVAVTTTPDTASTKVYLAGTTSSSTATGGLKVDTDIYFDATTGELTAKGFLGKATSASSADSATSATNDSKSQDIASTYIKGLSASEKTITYTKGDGTTGTITTQDTTYSNATQTDSGLMSSEDKTKLDGIQSGAQVNTVTGVKGDSETSYRTGNINITPTDIGLGNVTNESKATMFTNAALTGTPTAPTADSGTNTTQIASTAFVQAAIDKKIAAADAMIYKGTIGTDGTVTSLPATHSTGWTYKVITAGTYAGVKCEVGDMVICLTDGTVATDSHWTVVQNNIDGAVTGPASSVADRVAIFSGTSGKIIADSGYTIASSVPSDAKFTDTVYTHPSNTAYSSGLYKVTVDDLGHVTAATAVTKSDITELGIPGSDTDTHYTTRIYAGESGTAAHAATTNPYVKITDNNTYRNQIQIKGSGATTVSSAENGVITISSTDTNTDTTYSAGAGISLSGTTFSNSGVRSIDTGTTNGTISVDTNGTTADVAVKGLGSAAFTDSSDYASSSHGHSAATSSVPGYMSASDKAVVDILASIEPYLIPFTNFDDLSTKVNAFASSFATSHVRSNSDSPILFPVYTGSPTDSAYSWMSDIGTLSVTSSFVRVILDFCYCECLCAYSDGSALINTYNVSFRNLKLYISDKYHSRDTDFSKICIGGGLGSELSNCNICISSKWDSTTGYYKFLYSTCSSLLLKDNYFRFDITRSHTSGVIGYTVGVEVSRGNTNIITNNLVYCNWKPFLCFNVYFNAKSSSSGEVKPFIFTGNYIQPYKDSSGNLTYFNFIDTSSSSSSATSTTNVAANYILY